MLFKITVKWMSGQKIGFKDNSMAQKIFLSYNLYYLRVSWVKAVSFDQTHLLKC